ncbi:MAG: ATP synthase subunit I [Alphaproteobacteria bacterium]|nr:ATP synthase subunit I [Alphaproteobacteria bacterium]
MIDIHALSICQILISLGIGIVIGLIYLFLLWQTLLKLPSVKRKGNFLFLSAIIRLTLLIFCAIYFSFDSGARFLLIIIGFIMARIITLKYVKKAIHKEYTNRKKEKTIC